MKQIVLDSGALIALEKRDRRMLALTDELVRARLSSHVPAGVVAQVWRGTPRQHAVARLLRSGAVRVHPLTEDVSFQIGVLLGASRSADVVDGHVAILASSLRATVITSDPDDLRRLAPGLDIVSI